MKQFISWMGKRMASAMVTAVFFILAVIGIVYAVTFPTTAPDGTTNTGGKFMTYFNNMKGSTDCPSGQAIIGFNSDFTKKCQAFTAPAPTPTPAPAPACVPDGSCSATTPACGATTTGVNNCGAYCEKKGSPCPVYSWSYGSTYYKPGTNCGQFYQDAGSNTASFSTLAECEQNQASLKLGCNEQLDGRPYSDVLFFVTSSCSLK
ncbi:MAG: hypothetical protein PHH70_04360 [Candidatus Gracilibacteria bacterium]|nr:hypothetical protein [Candidatus Gracilibacteria bacterium]